MFASMFLFSFAMSITTGPVNTVILSTSLNHGLKRSLPYISGATIGFTLLLIFMAFGLQSLLTQFPVVLKILAVCGTLFVCYIGIKIILFPKPQRHHLQSSAMPLPVLTQLCL